MATEAQRHRDEREKPIQLLVQVRTNLDVGLQLGDHHCRPSDCFGRNTSALNERAIRNSKSEIHLMFTGIIEELGRVRSIERRGEGARLVIEARTVTEGSRDGDSIAVNGVCLTALEVKPESFAADVSKETLFRSTLGNLQPGLPVNLERAVTPATRLGGHIVQGHVDARGKFLGSENHGDSWTFRFAYPKEVARYLVFKGSVAV